MFYKCSNECFVLSIHKFKWNRIHLKSETDLNHEKVKLKIQFECNSCLQSMEACTKVIPSVSTESATLSIHERISNLHQIAQHFRRELATQNKC